MELPFAESWKIKMVEPLRISTRAEREQWIKEAHYNLFNLKSDQVYIDCLTDSGTGAMSDRQWAAMMMGDESYAGSASFFQLKETITRSTGFEYVIPTHQGRAAENVLFSHLVTPGAIVPGNSHFDTTKGHIESRKAFAVDCTVDEAKDTQLEVPFKGNVDPKKLEAVLAEKAELVPFIIVTITNNTAGGQPVSMQNLREVRAIADKYGKRVIFDSARFVENAYFIYTREEGYGDKTMEVKGRCLMTGLPRTFTVSSSEMIEAFEEVTVKILEAVHSVLERTAPELVGDIATNGIVMTGGGSLIYGFDKLIEAKTGIATRVADDAISCVAYGTGKSLDSINAMQDGTMNLSRKRQMF